MQQAGSKLILAETSWYGLIFSLTNSAGLLISTSTSEMECSVAIHVVPVLCGSALASYLWLHTSASVCCL